MGVQGGSVFGSAEMRVFFATAVKKHWNILDRCGANDRLVSFWFAQEGVFRNLSDLIVVDSDHGETDENTDQ